MQSTVEKMAETQCRVESLPVLPIEQSGNVTPGIYQGVSNEAYHSAPGISSSQLKLFCESQRHFEARYITGEMPYKSSKAMERGTMVHMAVLEPDLFDATYSLSVKPNPEDYPDALKTGDDLKAACKDRELPTSGKKADLMARLREADSSVVFWDDILASSLTTKAIVEADDYEVIMRMRDSVWRNPKARDILSYGIAEESVFSYHNETGLPIKCRPDWSRPGIMADLKSCRSAKPALFARDVHNLKYHVQQAMYQDCSSNEGLQPDVFAFIAIESEAPYICEVFILNDASANKGREIYQDSMLSLNGCLASNIYNGYTDAGISELSLPGYAL